MLNQNVSSTQYLFDDDIGHHVFGACMSRKRFSYLLARLSFDDKTTRPERFRADRFAAVRQVFEIFNLNCSKHLGPPELLAIDETLYPCRTKIGIKQYNPSKPARYGLLFQSLNAVKWPFTHSIIVAAGKPPDGTGPFYVNTVSGKVKKLVNNCERKVKLQGRNISTDRYYTGIEIAEWLLREKKVTMLGTLQKNRVGLPPQVVSLDNRETHSYEVFWEAQKGVMELHSYAVINKSKGKKNVLLLSTNSPYKGITKGHPKNLPAAIQLYNFTKGGTDIVDQRMGRYSTKPKSNKWTRVVFSYLLDTARVNAQTIWSLNKKIRGGPRKSNSFEFGIDLAKALVLPYIEQRPTNGLQIPIQVKMSMFLKRAVGRFTVQDLGAAAGDAPPGDAPPVQAGAGAVVANPKMALKPHVVAARIRCTMCYEALPRVGHKAAKDNVSKVNKCCVCCGEPACADHTVYLCLKCSNLFVPKK